MFNKTAISAQQPAAGARLGTFFNPSGFNSFSSPTAAGTYTSNNSATVFFSSPVVEAGTAYALYEHPQTNSIPARITSVHLDATVFPTPPANFSPQSYKKDESQILSPTSFVWFLYLWHADDDPANLLEKICPVEDNIMTGSALQKPATGFDAALLAGSRTEQQKKLAAQLGYDDISSVSPTALISKSAHSVLAVGHGQCYTNTFYVKESVRTVYETYKIEHSLSSVDFVVDKGDKLLLVVKPSSVKECIPVVSGVARTKIYLM